MKEAQDELEAETETSKKDALKTEIAERQEKLSILVAGFEVRRRILLLQQSVPPGTAVTASSAIPASRMMLLP